MGAGSNPGTAQEVQNEVATNDVPELAPSRETNQALPPAARVLQFHRQPRKLSTCTACGDHFFACQSWHSLCFQCFAGNRLYLALARYREARS